MLKTMRKRTVLFGVGAVLAVSLSVGGAIIYKNWQNNSDSTDVPETILSAEDQNLQLLETDKSPSTQITRRLILADTAMRSADYGKAVTLLEEALAVEDGPADLLQIARRSAMYAYSLSGNKEKALEMAKQYQSAVDPSATAEVTYIAEQITKIEAGQAISPTGGSEEGE